MNDIKNNDSWGKYMMWACIIVLLIMVVAYIVISCSFSDMAKRGQFGDMFGALNALFSGLAFAGLIITIRQQHIDLDYQWQTVKQTNDEMERQTKEFEIQNRTLKRQQFDHTFFELLRMLQSIVESLELNVEYSLNGAMSSQNVKGKFVFQELYIQRDDKMLQGSSHISDSFVKEIEQSTPDEVLARNEYKFLYHYFRFVYRILKFVDETPLLKTTEDRYGYVSFLRSTFSNYETAIIFYNCLTDVGKLHFKSLAERYALFDNIDEKLITSNFGKELFAESAFKFRRILNVADSCFRMRAVSEGEYQWQLDLKLKAVNADIKIDTIQLLNKQNFWTDDNGKDHNYLNLIELLKDDDIFDIAKLNDSEFMIKGKTWYKSHELDVNGIILEEGNGVLLTCADLTYSTHIMRDYDPMPKDGWSIIIQDTYGNSYATSLQLDILGKEPGYFA